MPNWCMNEVVVKCPTMEVAVDLLEKVTEKREMPNGEAVKQFSFAKVKPEPEDEGYMDQPKDGMPNWYSWRVANWGTKWDTGECTIDVTEMDDHAAVVFVFDTAWSPSLEVSVAMSEMFPQCMIVHSYDEPGMDFGGYEVYANGETVEQQEGGSRSNSWSDLAEWSAEYQWSEMFKEAKAP